MDEDTDELRIYIVMIRPIGEAIPRAKFGVEVAHAAVSCMMRCIAEMPLRAEEYFNRGMQPKIVLQVDSQEELMKLHTKALEAGHISEMIVDAARTVFTEPTLTCIGIGPIWKNREGKFIKRVRLYQE